MAVKERRYTTGAPSSGRSYVSHASSVCGNPLEALRDYAGTVIVLAATPIGNLGDASPRLRELLASATIVAAEDTRTTVRLLSALGIENRPRLIALHDHNEKQRAAELIELASEHDLVIVSDAGMPTVSDPGFGVVQAAVAAGIDVTVVPGPSAVLSALAVSGLPSDRFTFEGFAPRKPGERQRQFAALASEPRTMIFFDAPSRVGDTLAAMAEAFGGDRRATLSRELTKLYEQTLRGTLDELREQTRDGVRGEVVLVVAGAEQKVASLEAGIAEVQRRVSSGERLKFAASEVAAETGLQSRALYQGALEAR